MPIEVLKIHAPVDHGDYSDQVAPLFDWAAQQRVDKDTALAKLDGSVFLPLVHKYLLSQLVEATEDFHNLVQPIARHGRQILRASGARHHYSLLRTRRLWPQEAMFRSNFPWHTDLTQTIAGPHRALSIASMYGTEYVIGDLPGWTSTEVEQAIRQHYIYDDLGPHADLQDAVTKAVENGDLGIMETTPYHLYEFTSDNIHRTRPNPFGLPITRSLLVMFGELRSSPLPEPAGYDPEYPKTAS